MGNITKCDEIEMGNNWHTSVSIRQVLSFGLVGGIGFLVDASVLVATLHFGFGLYFGRVVSFLVAVTATWILNRRYTFRVKGKPKLIYEWWRYTISQLAGASVNLGVYYLLVLNSIEIVAHPTLGVAAGSLSGMIVNFLLARKYVFATRAQ
jgi:putative flippase GtrA